MASIAKIKDQIASMKNSQARARLKKKSDSVAHTVVAGAAAFAMGRVEKTAKSPLPTIFGLDHKVLYGTVAHAAAVASSGKTAEMLSATGDGLIAAYGYAEGKGQAMSGLAGDDFDEPV